MPLGMNKKGVAVSYFNQIWMVEVTGIGIIGKDGLLLHSQFGARLMLGGIITIARLPEIHHPDANEPSCPSDCRICAEVCPVNAIHADQKIKSKLCAV
jgi:epoxyqueuosine reductase QueG